MRSKLVYLVAALALLLVLVIPVASVGAVSIANITITATGSEIDISVDPTAWDVGTVQASDTPATAIDYFTLTSGGSEDVDVTIGGRSMKNVAEDHTWTMTNTFVAHVPTVDADVFGMVAGLDDAGDLFDIDILNVGETLSKLVDGLATGTQDFGLKFYVPSSGIVDAEVMEMVGAAGHVDDSPRGLVLTGSI